jgi:hypothetical protein
MQNMDTDTFFDYRAEYFRSLGIKGMFISFYVGRVAQSL